MPTSSARPAKSDQIDLPFLAAFEGPALDTGRMNVRDFAPSLEAAARLIETASETYFGVPGAVTLQVRSDFRRGSFEFGLVASAMIVGQQIIQNVSLSDLKVLLEGIGVIGKSSKSFLRLLLKHGDKPFTVHGGDGTTVNIHVHGNKNKIIVNNVDRRVAKLMASPTAREAVPQIVHPLTREGINGFRVGATKQGALRISRKELPKLRPPLNMRNPLADSVARTAIELLSPNFVDGNKWRVAQGGEPFWVRILDDDFLAEIDSGEKGFAKGDYLIVQLRTQAYSTVDGMVVERDVVKVIDHKHRVKQLAL